MGLWSLGRGGERGRPPSRRGQTHKSVLVAAVHSLPGTSKALRRCVERESWNCGPTGPG